MRFVIQRVNYAKCTIDGNITGSIEKGLCVLIGVAETDTKEIADKMIKKLVNMRIFADENDKTNLSINDVNSTNEKWHFQISHSQNLSLTGVPQLQCHSHS